MFSSRGVRAKCGSTASFCRECRSYSLWFPALHAKWDRETLRPCQRHAPTTSPTLLEPCTPLLRTSPSAFANQPAPNSGFGLHVLLHYRGYKQPFHIDILTVPCCKLEDALIEVQQHLIRRRWASKRTPVIRFEFFQVTTSLLFSDSLSHHFIATVFKYDGRCR